MKPVGSEEPAKPSSETASGASGESDSAPASSTCLRMPVGSSAVSTKRGAAVAGRLAASDSRTSRARIIQFATREDPP